MNLEKYVELSGITVTLQEETFLKAQIKRTRRTLETMLGFALCPDETNTNIYNELGKLRFDGYSCLNIDTANLLPPDETVNSYKIFTYNRDDKFLDVDPFTELHNVKLVRFIEGSGYDFVSFRTFNKNEMSPSFVNDGIAKYIQKTDLYYFYYILNYMHQDVKLAIDADWMTDQTIPDDLMYVWADMVTFYSNPKRYVKSENITSHRYQLDDKAILIPETIPNNLAIIKRYAGPYGSVSGMPL